MERRHQQRGVDLQLYAAGWHRAAGCQSGVRAEFETTLNIVLSTPTPGATIYYTVDGSDTDGHPARSTFIPPLSLVSTTTIKAFATVGGNDSLIVEFTYTKTGPVCPELTSGNFGWIDYSGGSNSNADLKNEIEHPRTRGITWYYRNLRGCGRHELPRSA